MIEQTDSKFKSLRLFIITFMSLVLLLPVVMWLVKWLEWSHSPEAIELEDKLFRNISEWIIEFIESFQWKSDLLVLLGIFILLLIIIFRLLRKRSSNHALKTELTEGEKDWELYKSTK